MAVCVVAAGAALVVVGCGGSVTSNQAASVGSTSAAASPTSASVPTPLPANPRNQVDIMPCTDLTPADISAMGLDPATKAVDNISGQVQNHGCRWLNSEIIVSFLASDGTVAMFNDPQHFANVRLLTIAGLPAVSTQVKLDTGPDSTGCYVVADIAGAGSLGVQTTRRARAADPNPDTCAAAVRFMAQAAPILLKR